MTPIDPAREALRQQGVKLAMDDLGIVPLFQLVNSWAVRKGLRYTPRMDERTIAMGVRPE